MNTLSRILTIPSRGAGTPRGARWFAMALFLVGSPSLSTAGALGEGDEEVSFSRDIRGLLSDRCYPCHGPDSATREAGLRLDTFELATAVRKAGAPIVPGDPEASLVFQRVSTKDLDDRMPPETSHRGALDTEQLELFRGWIEQGAQYEEHWAFVSPAKGSLAEEGRNPIDILIQERLDEAGLAPAPAASSEIALRRLFLDITGLPASLEEIDAFLADCANRAPQEVWLEWIEKLFTQEPYASRYAERMASPWMDQARYADTSGIHMDAGRQIWPWRDWVIEAYRTNKPFDEFITEQLAGDLIPNASQAQKVASGFNRNHVTTDEGGAINEEYLVEYAADRVETTASVMLGLTVSCARCHDHKFDPISQAEYYSLFAFFASNEEPGLYSQQPDANRAFEPFMELPSEDQAAQRLEIEEGLKSLQAILAEPTPADRAALDEFCAEYPASIGLEWAETEVSELHSAGGATLEVTAQGTLLASGENPSLDTHSIHLQTQAQNLRLLQLDVLGHESFTNGAPGRADNGNAVLTGIRVEAVSMSDPAMRRELGISWQWADSAQENEDWSLQRALDPRPNTGWAIAGHTEGKERVALFLTDEAFGFEGGTEVIVHLEYNSIYAAHVFGHVRLGLAALPEAGIAQLPLSQGHWYLAGPFSLESATGAYAAVFEPESIVSLDLDQKFELEGGGQLGWQFRPDFKDGGIGTLTSGTNIHYLAREIYSPNERQVEVSLGSDDGFALFLNGEQVAAKEVPRGVAPDQDQAMFTLNQGRNTFLFKVINTGGSAGFYYRTLQAVDSLDANLVATLVDVTAHADGGESLVERVTHSWRLSRSPEYRAGQEELATMEASKMTLEANIPHTMVMKELAVKRTTYVLKRGEYDKPDKDRPVEPGIPAVFGALELQDQSGAPRRGTRLDLANWLCSEENPLVARVAVNRLWQMVFGTGLVATSGDFGHQGEWPSHSRLLDWLAVEFQENDWDVQHILTIMLSSDTYRQSSSAPQGRAELDSENRLLAYFPRRRLDAERIRDQALYVSGLLVEKVGGASVKPYHPDGLWREVAMPQSNTRIYERGGLGDLWRRSLYTYWKRACPPPSLMTFDAPTREACVTQRSVTNTPLQALVLWNDEQYLEAARVLAERTLSSDLPEAEAISAMFKRCTGRSPSARELELLSAALADHLVRFMGSPEDAASLANIGEKMRVPDIEDGELAAWTLLASALLNLHATITQG